MDNEEKDLNQKFTETVEDELNSNEEIKYEDTILDSEKEIGSEELNTNADEVISNAFNKEENNTEDTLTFNNKNNKKSNPFVIIILLLLLIIIGVGIYFVCDKYIRQKNNKGSNTNEPTTTKAIIDEEDNSKIQVEIKDNRFYVNGNMVDFYSAVPEDILAYYKESNYVSNEDEFYSDGSNQINYGYYILKDIVYVYVIWPYTMDGWDKFFVDENGKIIKTIGDENSDIELSNGGKFFTHVDKIDPNNHYIDGNEIYFMTIVDHMANYASDAAYCDALASNKLDEIIYYIDKVTYLSNGEFKVEKAIETIKYRDLIFTHDDIHCSTSLIDYGSLINTNVIKKYDENFGKAYLVNNLYNYIAVIDNNKLELIDYNGNIIKKLYDLDNENYHISNAMYVSSDEEGQKQGIYIDIMDENKKSKLIYYNEKANNNSIIQIEIKDNRFYINGHIVDFYSTSDYKDNYSSENEFYDIRNYDYEIISDVIFVKSYFLLESISHKDAEYYFVDKDGNIIQKINGDNSTMKFSVTEKNNYPINIEKVEGNSIYFDVYKNVYGITGGSICRQRYNSELMKDVLYYVDKITYLGNGEFSIDNKVDEMIFEDYMLEKYPFVECYTYTRVSSEYGYKVDGIDNYYVNIENDILKLVDGNGTLINELVTLQNSSDYILEMAPGARYMKVEDNTKICSVSRDGIYVFMGSNRSLGDMHKDYSHMYVIYYNINTGEKSELINADVDGHFGELATCR